MVSLRRHFVPNPVSFTNTRFRTKCKPPLGIHTRYDGVSQLVDLQRGQLNANKDAILSKAFAEDWGLDATGNWSAFRQDLDGNGTWDLDQARAHNKANEVTSASSWATPSHDRAGNMVALPKPGSPADALGATFDAWNRMVKVEDGQDIVAEYQYTPDNRRAVKKTYSGGALSETRHFYYTDDWQTIEERTASGGTIAADPDTQYVWGKSYVDHLILRDRDTTANGTLDERLFALEDANWNVTALVDASGDVVERYTYTPYGTLEVRDAAFQPTGNPSAYAWPYTYTTRRLDAETGLMYYRNRMYHSELGRFVSRDPIGYEAGDGNLYRYVGDSPTVSLDPTGLALAWAVFWDDLSSPLRRRPPNPGPGVWPPSPIHPSSRRPTMPPLPTANRPLRPDEITIRPPADIERRPSRPRPPLPYPGEDPDCPTIRPLGPRDDPFGRYRELHRRCERAADRAERALRDRADKCRAGVVAGCAALALLREAKCQSFGVPGLYAPTYDSCIRAWLPQCDHLEVTDAQVRDAGNKAYNRCWRMGLPPHSYR